MNRVARMSINATKEQSKKVSVVARRHKKTASEIVRMCVDHSIDEIDRKLAESAKILAAS